jgi:hemolysin-activating ACP:hemolysin acyltransferase
VIYYFQDTANIKSGDRIYEDYSSGQQIFLVDFSAPVRGRGGKVVYWVAGATRESKN